MGFAGGYCIAICLSPEVLSSTLSSAHAATMIKMPHIHDYAEASSIMRAETKMMLYQGHEHQGHDCIMNVRVVNLNAATFGTIKVS